MIAHLYAKFLASTGVTTDTRSVKPGNVFFALKGPNFNGNNFADRAIHQGCSLAVVDEWRDSFSDASKYVLVDNVLETLQDLARHHRSKLKIPILGLTGSNGKTTTKELIKATLSQSYRCFATEGNLNNHIGVPLSVLSITPKHEIAVIEMGANHQKEIAFLCSICKPEFGLITNIGLAHLEGFGGEQGVYLGKKELFDYLFAHHGKLFVNLDDAKIEQAAAAFNGVTYGSSQKALYQGDFELTNELLTFRWWRQERPEERHEIQTNLSGSFNFTNALAAVAVGRYFGIPPRDIKRGLEAYKPKNQRSQVEKTTLDNTVIVDCYNANPSSMQAAIQNMANHGHKSKTLILGDMLELGSETDHHHKTLLRDIRDKGFSNVILVGENFRKANDSFGFLSFLETNEVAEHLRRAPISGHLLLLKGSRKKKLEALLELL